MHVTMEQTWQRITHDMQEQLGATEGQLALAQEQRKCAEQQRDLAEQQLNAEKQCKEEAEGLVHALEQEICTLEGTIRKEQQQNVEIIEDNDLGASIGKSDLGASIGKSITPEGTTTIAGGNGLEAACLSEEGELIRKSGRSDTKTAQLYMSMSNSSGIVASSQLKPTKGFDDVNISAGKVDSTLDESWSDWFAAQHTVEQNVEVLDEPEVEFEPASSQPENRDEAPWIPIVGHVGRSNVATPVSQSSLNDPSVHDGLATSMMLPLSRTNSLPSFAAIPVKYPRESRLSPLPQQQRVMQPSPTLPSKVNFALPFSSNERERLRKLAMENVALLDANYKTRMLLDEMTSRLQRMRGAAAERGQAKAAFLVEIAAIAGLGEVFGSAPRNVFERLYWDGLLRLRRLEEVTRKIHEQERREMLQAASSSNLGPYSAILAAQTKAVLARFDHHDEKEGKEMLQAASSSNVGPHLAVSSAQTRAVIARSDHHDAKEGKEEASQGQGWLHAHQGRREGASATVSMQIDDKEKCDSTTETVMLVSPGCAGSGSNGCDITLTVTVPAVSASILTPFSSPSSLPRTRKPKKSILGAKKRSKSSEDMLDADKHVPVLPVVPQNPKKPLCPSANWHLATTSRGGPVGPPVLVSTLQHCCPSKAKLGDQWWGANKAAKAMGTTSKIGRVGSDAGAFVLPALPQTLTLRNSCLSAVHRQSCIGLSGKAMCR